MSSRLFNIFYAPLAAVLFVCVVFCVCMVLIAGPTLAMRRAIGRLGVRFSLLCIGVPLGVRGLENLPAGPAICVSNHASYLDGLVLTAALPARYTFVVQDGAAGWPLVGLTIRRMGVSFINRGVPRAGAVQTRALLKRLQAGESLAIFPEGTFEKELGLLHFKNGAFLLAERAGVPIVPAVIRGTRRLWGGGRKLPRWSAVGVEFLPARAPEGTGRAQMLALRDNVRRDILARCGEPDMEHPHAVPNDDKA